MDPEGNLQWFNELSSRGVKPGHDNIDRLLSLLGDPQKGLRCIHVAGTDGKGSVCAMLESVLMESGFVTGTFTSPQILKVNECLRISGVDIEDRDLVRLIGTVRPHADEVEATQFETLTAMAFSLFSMIGTDFCIIEVGMGGESDATNVITPEVSVINRIGLEHTAFLGPTIRDIALQKAGIMKPGVPCVTINEGEALEALREHSKKIGCELVELDRDDVGIISLKPDSTSMTYGEDCFTVGMPGGFQAYNAALAVEALKRLPEYEERIVEHLPTGLESANIPCRFQKVMGSPIILDVTHTARGMEFLSKGVLEVYGKVTVVLGILSDKDVEGICREVSGMADRVFITAPDSPRAMPAETLYGIMTRFHGDVTLCDSVGEAMGLAIDGTDGKEILVTGSFRTVEDALKWIQRGS